MNSSAKDAGLVSGTALLAQYAGDSNDAASTNATTIVTATAIPTVTTLAWHRVRLRRAQAIF
jgi:hypothetical protein